MNTKLLNTKLTTFFSVAQGQYFFLPLWAALYAVYQYLLSVNLELTSFPSRMIGVATLDKVDVAARVGMFTHSILVFLIVFIIALMVINFLLKQLVLTRHSLKLMNHVALGGLILLIFATFGIPVKGSLSFIIVTLLLIAMAQIITYFSKSNFLENKDKEWLVVVIALGLSTYFFVKEVFQLLLETSQYIPLHPYLFIAGGILLAFTWLLHRKKEPLERMAFIAKPLLFLPVLSVMCDEIYLILNNREIFDVTPKMIYVAGIVVLIAGMIWQFAKSGKWLSVPSLRSMVEKHYLPILLFSLGAYTFYNPILIVYYELFELGNPALGIQRFHLFGEIPLLETFNSHLFAELFFGFIYTFINGFQGLDYHLYYYLNRIIYGLVCYFFFYRAFNNAYIAVFLMLFMAYITTLMPRSFYWALFAIFILYQLFHRQRIIDYFLFFFILCFLIIWRIDIGFANIISLISTGVVIYFLSDRKPSLQKIWRIGLISIVGVVILLGIVILTKDIPIFENAQKALHYLSSTQTYGYLEIIPEGLAEMEWHYFIFPTIILLFLVYFLVFELKTQLQGENAFSAMALVYLSLFYLSNLQRGIVRHGLIEGTDEVHTSYGYLIIAFIPYFVFKQHTKNTRAIIFIIAAVGLISAFRYAGVENEKNVYHLLGKKIEQRKHIQPQETRIARAILPTNFEADRYHDIKAFLDKFIPDTATFIDFSNTPMLYFFTERKVPSYFNQNLLSIHDDYLQDAYIENMQKYNLPVVIYDNVPRNWFDGVDKVPNEVRHYRIAEYIFRNYHPVGILNHHTIWLANDIEERIEQSFKTESSLQYVKEFNEKIEVYKLLHLPMIWANYDVKVASSKVLYDLNDSYNLSGNMWFFSFPSNIDKSTGNYFKLVLKPGHGLEGDVELTYGSSTIRSGVFTFRLSPDKNEYLVRLSMQYRWTAYKNDQIRMVLPLDENAANNEIVQQAEIIKGD